MVDKLSIVNVKVVDNSNIDVTFSKSLTPYLITSNVTISTDTEGVPTPDVLQVKISGSLLSIECQPLTPLVDYYITFRSVSQHPFQSLNGDAIISEDGINNKYFIIGPLEADNPVRNYLGSFYRDNIYNLDDDQTIVSKYVHALSVILSKALYDIKQVKNENYLSFTVTDERKIRGSGPFDRLDEESGYMVERVGRTPTGYTARNAFVFDPFPSYPISLQRQENIEALTANTIDDDGFFNINTLTLNLSNTPVTRVNSIVFTLNTINPVYTYDIAKYGYQIKSSRYDQDFGFSYLALEENQIRISDKILSDPLFDLTKIIKVDVEYESKNLGVVIDPNNVSVYSTELAVREVLPPIINIFNLTHAPITDGSNNIPTLGGVTFNDPNTNSSEPHPAFKYEIPFRVDALPSAPGQYSVDYATGTVYVYGANLANDGTGPFPPLATYKYRLTYQLDIDYSYDVDTLDIVALPTGSLVDNDGTITFTYEEVLVPGVDYEANLHSEALAERIDNRLVAFNVLKTKNTPITNVFRVFNETSGEIYTISRWSDDKIYFRFNTPPRIISKVGERAVFQTISNELLFVNTELTNLSSTRIFKINLNNSRIISATEDGVASFINTSLIFSDANVFVAERWFNRNADEATNINNLSVGQYMVDYVNGVVYCAVSNTQGLSIGTATYKTGVITPTYPHLISVENIYYQISQLTQKNKVFGFTSFEDGAVVPETLEPVDEFFLNNFSGAPYQINNGSIGTFSSTSFVAGVTNQVKSVRGVFEYNDLISSTKPYNFAGAATSSGFNISVGSIQKQIFGAVEFDGYDYFVTINEDIPYLSPSITYSWSIIRSSDSSELWDLSGTVVPGSPIKLILSGVNTPAIGDQVSISYTISINDLSSVVVDYNKGDYFLDYTYLADEIIVSYEYGDNVIDFRRGNSLSANEQYFVTYRAGALRDALLKNFGTLVNVSELANFDIDFNRERYRDALTAALTSFIQGPTLKAIKNIGKTISHIEPQVTESAFINWSLGSSLLYPEDITTSGSFELTPVKHGNGVVVDKQDQTIQFPVNANIRFEEGTFETWVLPKWDGLDNDALLNFKILKDGIAIPENEVFVGAAENHPVIGSEGFPLTKFAAQGTPNTNKDGVYIYYDKDISGSFMRWYVRVVDGYVAPNTSTYKITVSSNGKFYDSKSLVIPKPSNVSIFTGQKDLRITITGGSFGIDQTITFLSDLDHYLLDFGKDETLSRLSIYKDVSGYMNFRIYDRDHKPYAISADVSAWKANEVHHVAASWKLNTANARDEIHLFIDGFEVPNIIKYGQKLQPYLHEKFRTVDPEEIVGLANRDIVGSVDLQTVAGNTSVTSSLNFGTYNIAPGDTIYIDEIGFSPTGYTIVSISGQTLALSAPMPLTLNNGRFSINRTQFTVTSDIDVAPNIAVSTIHTYLTGTCSGSSGSNVLTSATNFLTANPAGPVLPGYLIRVAGLTTTYTIVQVTATTVTISDDLPSNVSSAAFQVYSNTENEIPGTRAIRPSYTISKDGYFNNILTISNNVYAGDLILVRTLGLNHQKVRKTYYVWSDGQENVLMTQLPPPISLDEASIRKVIVPTKAVGPGNSTFTLGQFVSPNFPVYQPTTGQMGRTLNVTVSGNNVDFSSPVQVSINGVSGGNTITETIPFSDYGTIASANKYTTVNYVQVTATPIISSKNALTFDVKEKYSITHGESSSIVPVVRYSYYIGGGSTLESSDGYTVRDENFLFSALDTNNYLVIHAPASVAGYYIVDGMSEDRKTLYITPTNAAFPQPFATFTGGTYTLLNVNEYRSGLQNGYFCFENDALPSQAYYLQHGLYELEYSTYTRIKLDPLNSRSQVHLGTDFRGHHHFNGAIDQVKVYSVMLTDTRIGETIPANQRSITKDFNSLKALKSDKNTLMLVHFDSVPFTNTASFYTNTETDKQHFQSSIVINENFGNSIAITDKPIILSNDGILNTAKEGTIEFWVNPMFDSANDPIDRFYFDAYGAVIEEAVSVNNVSVKLSAPASQILSVTLKSGDTRIDYFAGGKLEIDTQRAIQEEGISISDSRVTVSKPILQVITVKLVGDFTGTDYFANGSISSDRKTIYFGRTLPAANLPLIITYQTTENNNVTSNTQVIRLNKKLPYQNTHVVVKYIPQGLQGDRMVIYKDKVGYLNFGISASGTDYVVRAPTRWARHTWHRVKAQYKINGNLGNDEMMLFIDGYQYTNVTYGANILFSKFPVLYGSAQSGGFVPNDGYAFDQNIKFKDPINELFIGSQYTGEGPIFSLLDNFRISTISRNVYAPYGEPIDVNYSTNLRTVFPVTSDLFTTYLMNFDKMIVLNDDFALLKNRKTGLFDFSVNILDSFGIVNSSIKVQEVLEKLIKVLKPANSRVFIQYIR